MFGERLSVACAARLRSRPWWAYRFARAGDGSTWIALPLTYMNRSGRVMRAVARRAGVAVDRLVVVTDNMDLPPGQIRMKLSGSPSSHNGIRSIEAALGTTEFARLYIGIGRPADVGVVDYVLGTFSASERTLVDDAINRAVEVVARNRSATPAELASEINVRRRA